MKTLVAKPDLMTRISEILHHSNQSNSETELNESITTALNFTRFMEKYALEIGGDFSEYDRNKSIIIFPLEGGNRFQTVLGKILYNPKANKTRIEFSSKICAFKEYIDLKQLLEETSEFCHAKFVLMDGYLQLEAAASLENVTDDLLREMITEVAEKADEWEYRLTGVDVH